MQPHSMPQHHLAISRRTWLRGTAALGGALVTGRAFGATPGCQLTESDIVGPYYRFGAPFRSRLAEAGEPGDRIVFYVTGVQAFGGSIRVTGEMYEDRERIWPGKPGNPDPYPWRFETEPEIVLEEEEFVPAVELAGELEHVRKWPAEHWQLAFQGQLRTVSEADAELLERRIRAGAHAAA